jgi:pimeloyl-ACP methyl ester carboxylesterase
MPYVQAFDATRLYYEEVGTGTAVLFVHEFAGDYRTWEPQLRHFARSHRCITFSQRGYPPSDVPEDPARYSQDIARDDITALLDGLGIEKAHIVGHSMGGYTALHFGRTAPTAALLVIPRTGHNVTSEEPAAFNAALAELFFAAESGRSLAHKKAI